MGLCDSSDPLGRLTVRRSVGRRLTGRPTRGKQQQGRKQTDGSGGSTPSPVAFHVFAGSPSCSTHTQFYRSPEMRLKGLSPSGGVGQTPEHSGPWNTNGPTAATSPDGQVLPGCRLSSFLSVRSWASTGCPGVRSQRTKVESAKPAVSASDMTVGVVAHDPPSPPLPYLPDDRHPHPGWHALIRGRPSRRPGFALPRRV